MLACAIELSSLEFTVWVNSFQSGGTIKSCFKLFTTVYEIFFPIVICEWPLKTVNLNIEIVGNLPINKHKTVHAGPNFDNYRLVLNWWMNNAFSIQKFMGWKLQFGVQMNL